jgi:ABC-type multidrug transport system permease subunit
MDFVARASERELWPSGRATFEKQFQNFCRAFQTPYVSVWTLLLAIRMLNLQHFS